MGQKERFTRELRFGSGRQCLVNLLPRFNPVVAPCFLTVFVIAVENNRRKVQVHFIACLHQTIDRCDPLGDVDNARIYSALIAIAAGQVARGRHDLWSVVGPLGSQVRFVYDPDALQVDPEHLKQQARPFVELLIEDGTPSSGRILRLFEQLFEEVTGEALIRPAWGEPLGAERSQ